MEDRAYDTPMRAIVLDAAGEPELAELDEPTGPGELVRVLACGLCGSDVEKIGDPGRAGAVLGHEVVAETQDGRRIVLVHHASCGACARCLAGHESTCEEFADPTIRPGGFAERVRARAWLELPSDIPDARGTAVEPLGCVLRGAARIPRGRVLVVGQGFIGRLFADVLRLRGDEVFAVDSDPRRHVRDPDGPVDAACLRAEARRRRAGRSSRAARCSSLDAPPPAHRVYRTAHDRRQSRRDGRLMREATALLPELDVPGTVLPWSGSGALDPFQGGRDQDRVHPVKASSSGPRDLRVGRARPEPG
jgi:hypothetical protein